MLFGILYCSCPLLANTLEEAGHCGALPIRFGAGWHNSVWQLSRRFSEVDFSQSSADIRCVVECIQSQFGLTADENGCLAVLHNRNHMVTTFGNSEWVTQSSGQVQSKSVTSCADFFFCSQAATDLQDTGSPGFRDVKRHILCRNDSALSPAQTRVGFPSGGRGKRMRELSPTECAAQLEEACARATVALTRAQRLCLIMGPLDMKGLLGAALVCVVSTRIREM